MAAENDYAYELQIGDNTFTAIGTDKYIEGTVAYYLYGIRFNRKIYQPGEIEAEISIKPKKTVAEAITMLLKKDVTLKVNGETVAENYYVHEILPQEKKDVNDQLFVKVSIFSKDKLMTLDKYSKVYVAKKLGSEILDVERKNFTPEGTSIEVGFADMRMLKYTHTRTLTNSMTGNTINIQIPSEFIHPYLVQYNETFYDFMARTANRCGEFLYFEDGRLNLGLAAGAPIDIENYLSVTYQRAAAGPLDVNSFARDSMKEGTGVMEGTNYDVVKKNAAGYPHDAFPSRLSYNSELALDEYFFPLYADKFSTFTREMGLAGDAGDAASTQIFPLLNQLLSGCEDYASFLVGFGINEAMTIKDGISAASSSNESGFSKYIDITDTTDRAKKLEQGDGKSNSVPFGTLSPDGWTTLDYYRDVRKYEEEQQLSMICIDMGTGYADVKLGSKIRLPGKEGLYTVVQILMVNGTWNHNYATYDGAATIQAKTIQNQKIFAIPDRKKKDTEGENVNLAYPPVLNVPVVRKAEAQTAFITANDDPKYQGRVRIVYPWQTENQGKLKELAEAEEAYAKAQKDLAEKQERLTMLEVELNTLKAEQADLESLHEKKDRKNSLKKREKELKKTKDEIDLLNEEIKKNQETIDAEEKKDEAERDKAKIKALKLTNARADERIKDLEMIKTDQEQYIGRLQAMQNDDNRLNARKAEIAKAISQKDGNGNETGKQKEYNDLKKEISDAEAEVQKKKEDVDKKVEDGMKALSAISSPWIRVTTPMATEGGGTFFKPRVGDEVLVSYDNGNVERPYVIGSLFSKNVLAPDERINRTVGPNLYANASIAIVSPNGHGITFKDPSSGDGFISGVYPGLGVVTNYISKVPMPHTKDLAGGIKIGDRYGLYSISMSSDKRSVSISSSMGKVNINAFTGITISAPNGDIKIQGKNVSISAGNNLSITSGTNITSGYEYKRSTKLGKVGEFVTEKLENVSKVVDMFVTPFIDTSLARATLEVFLRPIEGTLCVKSKRYLTLEAGSGKAMIKRDRFKNYDAEDMSREYDFFKRMIACLSLISSKLNKYSDTYIHLWKDAYNKSYTISTLGVSYQVNPSDPDILKECVHMALRKSWEEFGEDFLDNKLKDDQYQAERKADLLKKSNALSKSVYDLINHVVTIRSKNFFDGLAGVKSSYIEDTLKEVVNPILTEMRDEWTKLYLNGRDPTDKFLGLETPIDMYCNDTYLRRKMAALFLLKVAKHPGHAVNPFIKADFAESSLTEKHLTDNYWWSKFAVNFEGLIDPVLRTLKENTWDAAEKSVEKNILYFKKLKDRDVWADGKGGQILFSDQKDATINFDGGDLKVEEDANRYNIDRMRKVLSGL